MSSWILEYNRLRYFGHSTPKVLSPEVILLVSLCLYVYVFGCDLTRLPTFPDRETRISIVIVLTMWTGTKYRGVSFYFYLRE